MKVIQMLYPVTNYIEYFKFVIMHIIEMQLKVSLWLYFNDSDINANVRQFCDQKNILMLCK